MPASAGAAFTSTVSGDDVLLAGGDAGETLQIASTAGLFKHNRQTAGDPGFTSDFDWDTTMAGDQTLAANDTKNVVVTLGGGADKVDVDNPGFKTLTLDGGTENDVLNGSSGVETLLGGPGDDRISGRVGNDTASGGDGDDLLLWTNGDGSDKLDGDAGTDVVEVEGSSSGENFTVQAAGDRAQFARAAPGAFSLDLSAERLRLAAVGGEDVLTVGDGVPTLVDANGGAGADAFTGGSGADVLSGGSGADILTGGGGADLLDGSDGDDTLRARDGAADLVRCGAGTDSAQTDAAALDAASDCENVDATPPVTDTPTPVATLAFGRSSRLRARRDRVSVTLACTGAPCAGELVLRTTKRFRVRRVKARLVLGAARFALAAGETKAVRVKLPRRMRRLGRRIAVTATAGGVAKRLTVVAR